MFFFKIYLQCKDVEDQLSQRKAEVEKLIQEMREVNMESLAISPPEESKQFLDGNMIFEFSRHFFLLYYIKILMLPLFRDIRGSCLMKLSSKTLQNLPHFWNNKTIDKTQIVGFFISSNFAFVIVDALWFILT